MPEQLLDFGSPDVLALPPEGGDVQTDVLEPQTELDNIPMGIPEEVPTDGTEPSEPTPTDPLVDEPVVAEFTPITIDMYGTDDDIVIDSREALREMAMSQRNDKAWKASNQRTAEELSQVAQQLQPYFQMQARFAKLDPVTAAVFQDVIVNEVPLAAALERAKLQYQSPTDSLPDPNEDFQGYLDASLNQKFDALLKRLQPPNPQTEQQEAQLPPQAVQALQAISNASGDAFVQVRNEWHKKFGPEGQKIPGFDFSSDNAASWQHVRPRVRAILQERGLDPRQTLVSDKTWNEIFEKAMPKLVIAAKKAATAPQRQKATAQIHGARPSAGRVPMARSGPVDWFAKD